MIIELNNVSKKFKENLVIKNLRTKFESGNVYCLKGENGCGKTVLIKLICGYMKADKGLIKQDGKAIRSPNNYLSNAGIMIENVQFLPFLTLRENLEMLKDFSKKITDDKISSWIDYYKLNEFVDTKYKNLSLGTKQKLAIIQAVIHNPKILILDEPFNGLDERSVGLTKNIILKKKEHGCIVIVTTHIKENIDNICDVTYLVSEGKIVRI